MAWLQHRRRRCGASNERPVGTGANGMAHVTSTDVTLPPATSSIRQRRSSTAETDVEVVATLEKGAESWKVCHG